MIIKRVELRNILSHENTTVEFPSGVVAIVGPNGAGKSSIVDSIYMALFMGRQVDVRGGKKEHVVTRGASTGEIRVELEVNGKNYLATRRLHVSAPAEAYLYALEGESRKLRTTGVDSVVSELRRILGLSNLSDNEVRTLMKSTVIALQGDLTRIIDIGDAERREYILSLLGLGYLQRALEVLKEITKEKMKLEGEYDMIIKDLDNKKKTIEKLRRDKESLQKQIRELEASVGELEKAVSTIESRLRSASEYLSLAQRLESALAQCRIRELKERIEKLREIYEWWSSEGVKLKRSLEEKNELEEKIVNIEKEVSKYTGELSDLLGVEVRDVSDAERALNELRSKVEGTEAYKSLYRVYTEKFKATGVCPLCGSRIEDPAAFREHLESKLRELESTITTLREKLKVVERVFNTLRDKKSSLNALRELLDRKSSELTTLTERAENLCREHGVHRGSIGECLVELSKLSEEYSKCKAELESLRGLYAEIVIAESPEELLRRLMGISTLGLQIPVDLSINLARQLVSELGRVRETLLRKYEEETKRLTELKAKLERLRGQLESTRSQLEEYESDVKRLEGDVARLKKRIEAYEALEMFSEKYLGKSGVIARELTRVVRVELENRANTVLSRLGLREISIGEGFELYVKFANGLLPIDNASGGERVAVAIALRLALAELAMGKSPTVLILDEPTVHLDDERRTQVFSIIGELSKSLRQVIVVTHDEKVVDIADTVIRVENIGDISKVTVEKTAT